MNTAQMEKITATGPEGIPEGFNLKESDLDPEEYFLNMGPQHPSTHGVLRLVLRLNGETVMGLVPHLGYIHRGIEKMGENQTVLQYIHLTDRLDYLSAFINNIGVCMAVEKGMGIGVPERGEYIRVLVSELQRIQSHLLFWSVFGMDLGAISAFLYGFKERERISELFEELCGQRLTSNYFRPGGSSLDLPEGFLGKVRKALDDIKFAVDEYHTLVSNNFIIKERTKGIGVISAQRAVELGCSGPVLRATGVDFDLRKKNPYGAYPDFDFNVPVGTAGDSYDRYMLRLMEIMESVKIIEQAIDKMPDGPYRSKELPSYKLPKGQYYAQVESARGVFGVYVVAEGGKEKPYRIKNRSPNFSNLQALDEMARGFKIADLVTIMSTLDLVIPDIDR